MITNWKITPLEQIRVQAIVKRAVKMAKRHGCDIDPLTMDMDIIACHNNGTKLDLEKLLAADDFNFSHDVFGIRSHINRDTGKLERCFVPRCAV